MTVLGNAPAHWHRTTIGEIAEVRLGRQRSPKNHGGESMRPYLRAANVDWYTLRPDDIQEMNFTDDEMETYALREDDILVVEGSGSATEVGKCALVPSRFVGHAFQNTLIRVRPRDDVDPRWLMYRINAEAELGGFRRLARGVGIFHLGSTRTAKWSVAMPPVEEQRAIVEAIERVLSHVDAASRGVSRAQDQLGAVRISLLLTELRRHEQSVQLSDLCEIAAGPVFSSAKYVSVDEGTRLLRGANVGHGDITWDPNITAAWPTTEPEPREGLALRVGDIVLAMKRPVVSTGFKIAQVGRSDVPSLLVQGVARIRAREPRLSDWLYYAMQDVRFIDQIMLDSGQSTGPPYVSVTALRTASVPIPDDQVDLVDRVNALRRQFSRLSPISHALRTARERGAQLRRSILMAAFEGRLPVLASDASTFGELRGAIA